MNICLLNCIALKEIIGWFGPSVFQTLVFSLHKQHISTLPLGQGTVIVLSSARSLSTVEIQKSAVLGGHKNLACFV